MRSARCARRADALTGAKRRAGTVRPGLRPPARWSPRNAWPDGRGGRELSDDSKDKVGYEINFNRHFYKYTPPRPLEEIDADLKKAEEKIMRLLREVTE
jgi:hypothetical protein